MRDDLMLKFMQTAIKKINDNSATIYALEKMLIENGMINEKKLISEIANSKRLPEQQIGKKVLTEMLAELKNKSTQGHV
jgi:hypothetical protein